MRKESISARDNKNEAPFLWNYPLKRIQTGTALGNSYLGVLVWGAGRTLNITIGCSALWDHRGGMEWNPAQTFRRIAAALHSGDINEMRKIFPAMNKALSPTILSGGRLVITLPEQSLLLRNELDPATGKLYVYYACSGSEKYMEILIGHTDLSVFALRLPEKMAEIKLISGYALNTRGEYQKRAIGKPFAMPEIFVQELPADDAYGIAFRMDRNILTCRFGRHADPEKLKSLLPGEKADFRKLEKENCEKWRNFWETVPAIALDDPELEDIYRLGLFKFASMSDPSGVPAGLQGPWLEDSMLPPWSADYHFNINVQMCYWPALRAGLASHLRHLFDMIFSWRETMEKNAFHFAGIRNGIFLPHAVDDHCRCMGTFWTGIIDHACAAWMAKMMFDYYRWTGDRKYLREKIYPFMCGVMRVFEKMTDRERDGQLVLPVSISPEYRGAAINAWGRNSSFQLAALHRLALDLLAAAEILKEKPDPFWTEVKESLPHASITDNCIGLWDGLLLEESHRHHSHLGGIVPFGTIDPEAPEWKEIVFRSLEQWTVKGMGSWTGWSMPWAAMINMHCGRTDAAIMLMKLWKTCFTNEGGASLHDAHFKGFTEWGSPERGEIMQIDGLMGMTAAIQELLLLEQGGVLRLFQGIPSTWRHAAFSKMHGPDGLKISAEWNLAGKSMTISVIAEHPAEIKLELPREYRWTIDGKKTEGGLFVKNLRGGARLDFTGVSVK